MPAQLATRIIVRATTTRHTRPHTRKHARTLTRRTEKQSNQIFICGLEPAGSKYKLTERGRVIERERGSQRERVWERLRWRKTANKCGANTQEKQTKTDFSWPSCCFDLPQPRCFLLMLSSCRFLPFGRRAAQLENFCRQTAARMCTAGSALKPASSQASKKAA